MKKFCSLTALISCTLFTQQVSARIATHQAHIPTRQSQHSSFSAKQTFGTHARLDSSSYASHIGAHKHPTKIPSARTIIPITHDSASKPIRKNQLAPQRQTIVKPIAVSQTKSAQTSNAAAAAQTNIRTQSRDVSVHAAIAVAELIDKITILEIKLERIIDQEKLTNIRTEYAVLHSIYLAHVPQSPELEKLKSELIEKNKRLWDLEDAVRAKESNKIFDAEFVRIARDIYLSNDERGLIKRDINALVGSHIIEEKSYGEYRTGDSAIKRSWSETPKTPVAQAQNTITATVEMPVGELLDKITILEIKQENITNPEKLQHIRAELAILYETLAERVAQSPELKTLIDKLRAHNKKMWQIEDAIREKERVQQFDDNFIQLARSVYFTNDARCAAKREINMLLGSRLIEEKKYTEYKA